MPPEDFDTPSTQHDPLALDHSVSESRVLVALRPVAPEPASPYRSAPFLAQLVATKDQHPQTRERRRAEPSVASAAYRATAALTAV